MYYLTYEGQMSEISVTGVMSAGWFLLEALGKIWPFGQILKDTLVSCLVAPSSIFKGSSWHSPVTSPSLTLTVLTPSSKDPWNSKDSVPQF